VIKRDTFRLVRFLSISLFLLILVAPALSDVNQSSGELTTASDDEPFNLLVRYSFDDGNIESGPDTFAIYENSKGTVKLSNLYQMSGYNSIEIRDHEYDGDFPELQGYFPLRDKGKLYIYFALMIVNPEEELNIALAGPKYFGLQKDGIAFWLKLKDGVLRHVSDSIPQKLFRPRAYIWYGIQAVYDIDAGLYDLHIYEEGQEQTLVALAHQPNATNQPASSIDKFSFIGDHNSDLSNVTYYVDDVLITTNQPADSNPFVAPGRRRLFIHRWHEFQEVLHGTINCLPINTIADFGINQETMPLIIEDGSTSLLEKLLSEEGLNMKLPEITGLPSMRFLEAIQEWRLGCRKLARGDAETAVKHFLYAEEKAPEGVIYGLSSALALEAAGRHEEADERLAWQWGQWADDPRFALALAMFGVGRGEPANAEYILARFALDLPKAVANSTLSNLWAGEIVPELLTELKESFPDYWRRHLQQALLMRHYFFVLLWEKRYSEATQYAAEIIEALNKKGIPAAWWIEHSGDVALLSGSYQEAIALYERSIQPHSERRIYQKLADAYHLLNNLERERFYREKIYGTLRVD